MKNVQNYANVYPNRYLTVLNSDLKTYPKVLKRSLIGKAIVYAYSLLPRMEPYLYDGRIFIDNNRYENALRPLAISRKSMLLCGNHEVAENTVIICCSCKEYGAPSRECQTET